MDMKAQLMMKSMSPALSLVESFTSGIKAENEVAKFVEENFGILFETKESEAQLDMGKGLLTKMAVAEANTNPEFVEQKMLKFYNAFRLYMKAKTEVKK